MPRSQRLHHALHLHATRPLHQHQIARLQKLPQKFRRFFRRRKNFRLRFRHARRHRAFDNLRAITRNSEDPINLPRLRRKRARLAMQLRRCRAQLPHLPRRQHAPLVIRSRRQHRDHRVQRRRARVVAIIDDRRPIRKFQQLAPHRRRAQTPQHFTRLLRRNPPNARRSQRRQRIRNHMPPRQRQLQRHLFIPLR